ncbi:hypothetical protein TIFTF001_024043 [Ficus carica]|uniref:Uncharacterized protein n=1 Tax=Ficus carica TaxID=3494 RepID=A0AA88B0F6_FICCA|nr:hypothetical protein TIFTF001_024043 [Ficus carica]
MRQVLCQFSQVEAGAGAGTRTSTVTAGTGRCGRGSIDRSSRRGLGRGRGSVTQASTLDLDGGLLEVPKGELIRGSAAQWK